MNTFTIQRLLAVFVLACLLLSLSLQSSARIQMDALMMSMSASQVAQMDSSDRCGGCDDKDSLLIDCVSGTCASSVPAVLDSAQMEPRLPHAMLRGLLPHFHASLPPAPEPQPPRLPLTA